MGFLLDVVQIAVLIAFIGAIFVIVVIPFTTSTGSSSNVFAYKGNGSTIMDSGETTNSSQTWWACLWTDEC
jgi:hypothetical protein